MIILKVTKKNLKEIAVIVVAALKKGKVAVCPTDTVYGLIADATNKKAIERIFKIKKRNFDKTISLFVKDIKMAKQVAKIDRSQEKFAKEVWPGKAIVVFKAGNKFPKGIVCQWGKIGLRIPKYKLLNKILSEFNAPLVQTSANISGEPASGNIKEVLKQFKQRKNKPDLVISAGNLKKSRPSKVIDLTTKPPKILRY